MGIALGLIIFVIGCCLSTYEDSSYKAQRNAEQRHKELMKVLSESNEVVPKRTKRTQRRLARDKEGNMLAEEIIEEVEL